MMMDMKHFPEREYLIRQVEEKYGKKVAAPKEFEALSERILSEVGEMISASSLRRLFGYDQYDGAFRYSTLDVLSRYIGETDFLSFSERLKNEQFLSSEFLTSDLVRIRDLSKDDRVLVGWNPNRQVLLRCLGDGRLQVESEKNSKLREGDIFEVSAIVKGYPMYVSGLLRDGQEMPFYVAGSEDGITSVRVL